MTPNTSTNSLSTRIQCAQVVRLFVAFFLACPCEGEQFTASSTLLWLASAIVFYVVSGNVVSRWAHKSNS